MYIKYKLLYYMINSTLLWCILGSKIIINKRQAYKYMIENNVNNKSM